MSLFNIRSAAPKSSCRSRAFPNLSQLIVLKVGSTVHLRMARPVSAFEQGLRASHADERVPDLPGDDAHSGVPTCSHRHFINSVLVVRVPVHCRGGGRAGQRAGSRRFTSGEGSSTRRIARWHGEGDESHDGVLRRALTHGSAGTIGGVAATRPPRESLFVTSPGSTYLAAG